MSETPLKIAEDLIDMFYECEGRLEQVFGMQPIDPRVSPYVFELPYFRPHENEEIFEMFQKCYNDASNLMHHIKDLEEQ